MAAKEYLEPPEFAQKTGFAGLEWKRIEQKIKEIYKKKEVRNNPMEITAKK